MDETPNLKLPYILPAQSQKHVTHNEALRALDAVVQNQERLALLDAGPEHARITPRWKVTHTAQDEIEGRSPHRRERVADVLEAQSVDLPDEAKRQVDLFGRGPARAGHVVAERAEGLLDELRQLEAHEETRHRSSRAAPSSSASTKFRIIR